MKLSSFGGGVGHCPELRPLETFYNWEKGKKLSSSQDLTWNKAEFGYDGERGRITKEVSPLRLRDTGLA